MGLLDPNILLKEMHINYYYLPSVPSVPLLPTYKTFVCVLLIQYT